MIELYTIGFTQKSAQQFFKLLTSNGVEKIVDTRINNTSQLSGYAKADDLQYFAKAIGNMDYAHETEFAPTKSLLEKYRKKEMTWAEYEIDYLNLLDMRKIGKKVDVQTLHKHCLLCSEHTAEKCHRRLLAEYLQHTNNDIKIIHLS